MSSESPSASRRHAATASRILTRTAGSVVVVSTSGRDRCRLRHF
ncbi:hypothetical protein AB0L53_52735 [Nonomuraea sp. NPDC052129]